MPITYGSVCSGIEAATLAWKPLGMRAAWFAEIEAFPSAVLAHHYPTTPNLGDMTRLAALVLAGKIPAPDALVGGTPCQAFSVAGMREGLTDPRGALTIKYVELADAVDYVRAGQRKPASVIVWENVPGVLSDKGNAFGCFLGALAGEDCELQPSGKKWPNAGCVYGPKRTIAWRVLDAQYFGLAQRRRRVFVVASARDGFDPTEVLFEREGLRRDTAPSRGQGQDVTGTAPFGPALQCGCGHIFGEELGPYGCVNCEGDEGPAVSMFGGIPAFGGHSLDGSIERAATLTAKDSRLDIESETFFVVPPIDASYGRLHGCSHQDANHGHSHLIVAAFAENSRAELRYEAGNGSITGALSGGGGKVGQGMSVAQVGTAVRRLTPRECERLQGMPNDYTLIPWRGKPAEECPDGPRYKAIGNSKAVTVVRWIGRRILQQLTD
jgi:DNA (cytosine-5)-methyltransferase 1